MTYQGGNNSKEVNALDNGRPQQNRRFVMRNFPIKIEIELSSLTHSLLVYQEKNTYILISYHPQK